MLYGEDVGDVKGTYGQTKGYSAAHQGVDIRKEQGVSGVHSIYSLSSGIVVHNGLVKNNYTMLVIETDDPLIPGGKMYITYLHGEFDENLYYNEDLKEGSYVYPGQYIGKESNIGKNSVGEPISAHTHIEMSRPQDLPNGANPLKNAAPEGAAAGRTTDPISYIESFYEAYQDWEQAAHNDNPHTGWYGGAPHK